MLTGSHAPLFPIELVEKDFRYALRHSHETPIAQAAQEVYREAIAQGYGEDNITGVARLFLA